MSTMRALLAVAAIQDWYTEHMDVWNAFLHGDLEDTIYMKFPSGYTGLDNRIHLHKLATKCGKTSPVFKLLKALYSLKHAPKQWFFKLFQTLISLGFT